MNVKKFKNQKFTTGFTLIELLIVIAIIGLLASIVMVSMTSVKKKAKDSRIQAELRQISTAMEMVYSDNDAYPTAGTNLFPATNATLLKYLPVAPKNPATNAYYLWIANTGAGQNQQYCAWAVLTNETNAWITASEAGVIKRTTAPTGLGAGCR